MVGISVIVTGLKDLQKSFNRTMSQKVYDDILKDVANQAVIYAKHMAPVRTGRLMESIKSERRGRGTIEVSSDVEYASYQEFGTMHLPAGTDEEPYSYQSSSGKTAYRPFMRPAALKALRDAEAVFDKHWGKAWKG